MLTRRLGVIPEHHQKIFDFLLEVNQSRNLGTTLRVAGGWVRDALLGVPSNDIDVAIESHGGCLVTGATFAKEIVEYQLEKKLETRKLSVIKTNPDKSKHIETAQLTLFDVPLEFCHLRRDEYSQTSRVPTISVGTPREDALRRDFTVNALFFNLHTQLVEDFTTGFADLEQRLLRCPLDPAETFTDDPLRLLRGVRFAGQLGFRLDDSIGESVNADLINNLRTKVSRERLGIEWGKMMSGNAPEVCWSYIMRLRLYDVMLEEVHLQKSAKGVAAQQQHQTVVASLLSDDEETRDVVLESLSAADCPLQQLRVPDSPLYQPTKDDRLICAMFILAAKCIPKDNNSATRLDRVTDWVCGGLRLPVSVATAVRKMLDGLECLARMPWAETIQSRDAEVSPEARDILFDGLMCLTDKCVPMNAIPVLIFMSLEDQIRLLHGHHSTPDSRILDHAQRLMHLLNADPKRILDSAKCSLPIRGDEIIAELKIEPKATAFMLQVARRFKVHHPACTREEILAHLRRSL